MEICRHGCLDHCQLSGSVAHYIQERKDQIRPQYIESTAASSLSNDNDNSSADRDNEDAGGSVEQGDDSLYDDVIQNGDEMTSIGGHFLDVEKSIPKAQAQTSNRRVVPSPATETQHDSEIQPDDVDLSKPFMVRNANVKISRLFLIFGGEATRLASLSGTVASEQVRERAGAIPAWTTESGGGQRRRCGVTSDDAAALRERYPAKTLGDGDGQESAQRRRRRQRYLRGHLRGGSGLQPGHACRGGDSFSGQDPRGGRLRDLSADAGFQRALHRRRALGGRFRPRCRRDAASAAGAAGRRRGRQQGGQPNRSARQQQRLAVLRAAPRALHDATRSSSRRAATEAGERNFAGYIRGSIGRADRARLMAP